MRENADIFGLIETNLHGFGSRIIRAKPISEQEIRSQLGIPGYDLILPETWKFFSQARLIVFIKSSIPYKLTTLKQSERDLPIVTLVLRSKEVISYVYREYSGGISGLGDEGAQHERLRRMTLHWSHLCDQHSDITVLGDKRRIYENNY